MKYMIFLTIILVLLAGSVKCQRPEYGFLGVEIKNLDRQSAQKVHLSTAQGVIINRVLDDFPAKQAGLEVGDIITKIRGKKIKNVYQLQKIITETGPRKKVAIELIKKGQKKTLNIELEKMPEEIKLLHLSRRKNKLEKRITLDWAGVLAGCGIGITPGIMLLAGREKLNTFGKILAYTLTVGGSTLAGICVVDLFNKYDKLKKTKEEINQIKTKSIFSFMYTPHKNGLQFSWHRRF